MSNLRTDNPDLAPGSGTEAAQEAIGSVPSGLAAASSPSGRVRRTGDQMTGGLNIAVDVSAGNVAGIDALGAGTAPGGAFTGGPTNGSGIIVAGTGTGTGGAFTGGNTNGRGGSFLGSGSGAGVYAKGAPGLVCESTGNKLQYAPLNIVPSASGVVPTSPVTGDIWLLRDLNDTITGNAYTGTGAAHKGKPFVYTGDGGWCRIPAGLIKHTGMVQPQAGALVATVNMAVVVGPESAITAGTMYQYKRFLAAGAGVVSWFWQFRLPPGFVSWDNALSGACLRVWWQSETAPLPDNTRTYGISILKDNADVVYAVATTNTLVNTFHANDLTAANLISNAPKFAAGDMVTVVLAVTVPTTEYVKIGRVEFAYLAELIS